MNVQLQPKGLTSEQVLESRRLHGANLLTPPKKAPLWRLFLEKFRDPLIVILMVAACLSIGIACYEYGFLDEAPTVFFEPVGIVVAILLATGLAFLFEHKAEKEFSVLNQVNDDEPVEVVRDGAATKTPKRDVVVGDILLLETGQEVPADAELLDAVSMRVDESSLTGEPLCDKSADPSAQDPEATFPSNHVLRGTKVMEGHGVARVFAVGDHTENGRAYVAAQIDDSVKTPLSEQLDGLGRWVSRLSYAIAALVVVGRMVVYLHVTDAPDFAHLMAYGLQTVMIAVTLIVVAVPEGLPMAVTLALAYSMRRMLKTHNLVRRLHACETMGAATVICTDKTGTLTQNQMRVAEATDDSQRMMENCALNSTALLDLTDPERPATMGNPTEGALLLWLRERGCDYRALRQSATRLAEVPFSTERKWMATLAADATGRKTLYVKGAPEVVMALCSEVDRREEQEERLSRHQSQAMRTLGFAWQEVEPDESPIAADGTLRAPRLRFLGMVAISDPVRSDVPRAVQQCLDAGIDVKMVTGDNLLTAREIGREIGLWTENDSPRALITGAEMAALSDEELDERAMDLKIVARARPLDKKRLVEALQRRGQVVAVTGDGTNDAPALKAAHVGLSMGDGTSVAKEASDITIIDNSFASIGRAVMWGRSLYQNIQRFLLFQLTVNVAACLLVLSGAFMGTESPLTVTQMLWVNLIMDTFGAMALASLPPTPSVMGRPPRRREDFIIDRAMMGNIMGVGCFFFLLLLAFLYVFQHADVRCMADLLRLDGVSLVASPQPSPLTPYEQTLLFSIFVWTHFWYMFNARAFRSGGSGLDLKDCRGFGTIVAIIVVGQLLIVEVFPAFFNVVPMRWEDWLTVVALSSLVLWVREASRLLRRFLV